MDQIKTEIAQNCQKQQLLLKIMNKTDRMAHTLKTSPSRRTFRPDVEEADCCQQQDGGRAHRQSADGVRCRPGRRVESSEPQSPLQPGTGTRLLLRENMRMTFTMLTARR